MSADAVDAAEDASEFVPEIEMAADSLDYFEKPAEVVTAATSGPALRQQSCLGSSVVVEIELRKQDAVWKDLKSSYPEVQQQPQLDTYLFAHSAWRGRTLAASKD